MEKYTSQAPMSQVSCPERILKNTLNLVKLCGTDTCMVWSKNNFFKWFLSIPLNFKFYDLGIGINYIFENQTLRTTFSPLGPFS